MINRWVIQSFPLETVKGVWVGVLMIVVSFFTRSLLPKDEYTPEEVYLRVSTGRLRVTTRLVFKRASRSRQALL
jgi:hypothetical protein